MALTEDQKLERQHQLWERIAERVESAVLIEWDGCHKIYIHTCEQPEDVFKESFTAEVMSSDEMLETLKAWWDESCWLKLIQEVASAGDISGYISLIEQGEEAYADPLAGE